MIVHLANLAPQARKQGDCYEFEASLGYKPRSLSEIIIIKMMMVINEN